MPLNKLRRLSNVASLVFTQNISLNIAETINAKYAISPPIGGPIIL